MKIFKFLQGLVGFGNLRFAEIKSCPSASPTYELRKVEISSKNDLAKLQKFWNSSHPSTHIGKNSQKMSFYFFDKPPYYCREKKHKKTNILLFSADIHTYKLTFVFFAPSPNFSASNQLNLIS